MELREWDPTKGVYTGRFAIVEITYVQINKSNPCAISKEALADNYAVLSISLLSTGIYPVEFTQQLNTSRDINDQTIT